MQSPLKDVVQRLRASGEPTRMRLLALCAEAGLSVSDLAQALRQSEPRVSRHLKILCEAGLLERLRQGQWVLYRLSAQAEASSFVRGLLAQLDRRDPLLLRDAAAARTAAGTAVGSAGGTESRLGRALAEFVAAARPAHRFDSFLLVGVSHPELLAWGARASRECTALAPSRRATQAARAFAERRALGCRIVQAPQGASGLEVRLARARFDAVLLDHPLKSNGGLLNVLESAVSRLEPHGVLWLLEPYEAFEVSRERVVEHPIARLRRLLGEAGLRCEQVSPIEADGAHVLAAVAHPVAVAQSSMARAEGVAQ